MKRSILLTLGLGVALHAMPANAALVSLWNFDEGTGSIAGDSVGSNNGTITDATWFSDPERGSVLSFNGSSAFVDAGATTIPQMTSTNNFTWAFWAYNQQDTGTKPNAVVVGNRFQPGGGDFTPREFIKITPTKFEMHILGNGNDNLDVADMALNEWHHHAVVKEGVNLSYYIDGAVAGTSTITQPDDINNAQPLYFGGDSGTTSAGEFFNGRLDEVRIYDSALTGAEVGALIPEPSGALLLLLGAFQFLMLRRRS